MSAASRARFAAQALRRLAEPADMEITVTRRALAMLALLSLAEAFGTHPKAAVANDQANLLCTPLGTALLNPRQADKILAWAAGWEAFAAEEPTYDRMARRNVEALLSRAGHLDERTRARPGLSFDRTELRALGWALEDVIALRGPLPEELERVRATIFGRSPKHLD